MIDIQIERRLINFFVRLLAGLALLIILTSCSAAVALPGTTPTAEVMQIPTPTATTIPTDPPRAKASSTSAPSCTVSTGYNAGALNLRAGAGMGYEVIRVLSEGEALQVLERAAWLKVIDARGNQGFINAHYCS
jgi:uncharacterized protein YgiM (DUF1202 family)